MLFITAIRHLPTAWNLEQKLQGLRDIDIIQPIDKEDRDIIAQRKKYFKKIDHPIKSVYVSELKRTQQSANQYGFLTPTVSPLLNELDFGKYEGLSRAQLMDELEPRWTKNPLSLQLGESLQNLQQRVFDFLNLLEEQSHTLLFCHGNWMRALKSIINNGNINSMNTFQLKNNEMYEIKVDLLKRNQTNKDSYE